MNIVPAKWFNRPAEESPFHELAWLLYDRKDEIEQGIFDELIDKLDKIYEHEFFPTDLSRYADDKPRIPKVKAKKKPQSGKMAALKGQSDAKRKRKQS